MRREHPYVDKRDVGLFSARDGVEPRKVDDAIKRDFSSDASNQVTLLITASRSQQAAVKSLAAKIRGLPGANPDAMEAPACQGRSKSGPLAPVEKWTTVADERLVGPG